MVDADPGVEKVRNLFSSLVRSTAGEGVGAEARGGMEMGWDRESVGGAEKEEVVDSVGQRAKGVRKSLCLSGRRLLCHDGSAGRP